MALCDLTGTQQCAPGFLLPSSFLKEGIFSNLSADAQLYIACHQIITPGLLKESATLNPGQYGYLKFLAKRLVVLACPRLDLS